MASVGRSSPSSVSPSAGGGGGPGRPATTGSFDPVAFDDDHGPATGVGYHLRPSPGPSGFDLLSHSSTSGSDNTSGDGYYGTASTDSA